MTKTMTLYLALALFACTLAPAALADEDGGGFVLVGEALQRIVSETADEPAQIYLTLVMRRTEGEVTHTTSQAVRCAPVAADDCLAIPLGVRVRVRGRLFGEPLEVRSIEQL